MIPNDNRMDHGKPASETPRRSRAFQFAAISLILISGLAGTGLARWLRPTPEVDDKAEADGEKPGKIPGRFFRGWPKPDLAIVVSGSQHGYLLPCGCSRPQVGGLERRYNFIQALRAKGWTVAAVDVGDIPQLRGPHGLSNEQGLIKYRYAMEALKKIGYSAVSFGEFEAGLTLEKVLGEFALNHDSPKVIAANVLKTDELVKIGVGDWIEIKDLPIKTGVTAAIGPNIAKKSNKDPLARFEMTGDAMKRVLPEMKKAGIDLRILLYQGLATNHHPVGNARLVANPAKNLPKPEAIACAEAHKDFQIVLALSEDDEPAANEIMINDGGTLVTSLGHKGKYVGVVGVWKTKNPAKFDFKYQLVDMSEDFLTPKDEQEAHPIVALMEEYTKELQRENYLGKFGQTKHSLQVMNAVPDLDEKTPKEPAFVGSERCKTCHKDAYDVWKKSDHSHAYQTLLDKALRPSLRQFDAECIICHTTGYGYQSGFTSAEKTPKLLNVGCESCHGPGSHHALNSDNEEWQKRMNPWRAPADEAADDKVKRLGRIDRFCQECHDIDNDVTWTNNGFDRKWPKIAHPSNPPAKKPAEKKEE